MMHPEDWVRERANEPLSRYEQYSRDVTCIPEGVDLFYPTGSPRDLAISQAIRQAVDQWIADDMDGALTCLQAAEEFVHTHIPF
jgi:hypothetical protein